jgi:hypothetical protein
MLQCTASEGQCQTQVPVAAWSQVEISLQPWHAFKPDGVILFSDILTPLTGMNIPFDITAGKGPVIADPIRTMEVSQGCVWVHSACVSAESC